LRRIVGSFPFLVFLASPPQPQPHTFLRMAEAAPRGRGTGRGRGNNRGGRGGAQGAPLAVQMRQLDRLQEPDEMAVLRRLKGIALRVRSTYGANGLLEREVGVSLLDAIRSGVAENDAEDGINWVSLVDAEDLLLKKQADELLARRAARRATRLPANRQDVRIQNLTVEELTLLDMSQKDWDIRSRRFPAQTAPPSEAET